MNTGQRLKALRESKGLSQEEVAKIIGIGALVDFIRLLLNSMRDGENRPLK